MTSDEFGTSTPLTSVLPAGTAFTFSLTPVSGPLVNYTMLSNTFTNDSTTITALSNLALSTVVGQTVTVTWTLPTT